MKKTFFLLFLPVTLLAAATGVVVADFSREPPGRFPHAWRTWPFHRNSAGQVYRVAEEEKNRYLSAHETEERSEQIYLGFNWDAKKFPYFNWRWRAKVLPTGAKETDVTKNDSACGVYVVFGRGSGRSLKFTWSTTLPVGTIYEKEPGKTAFLILDSGDKNLNHWQSHSIAIREVYEKLLKEPMPRNPSGIAILTDGNATHSKAACDYDDFEISAIPHHRYSLAQAKPDAR